MGSLKYPGPHFRLAVVLLAADAAEIADKGCGDGGVEAGAAAIAAGGSVGMSDVLPLLAISASTIWTILSLFDGEYGSSNADTDGGGGDAVLLTTAAAGAAVLDDVGVTVVDVLVGLDVESIGSV